MFAARNITIAYEHPIVQNINFEIQKGDFFAIGGRSGCGKSSILKAVLGFVPFDGCFEYQGKSFSYGEKNPFLSNIAYIPQIITVPFESVSEYIQTILTFKSNCHLVYTKSNIIAQLEQLNLSDNILQKKTLELSGGELQRVAIAIALLLERDFLLLDEPTTGLDDETSAIVHDALLNHHASYKLIVSHNNKTLGIAGKMLEL